MKFGNVPTMWSGVTAVNCFMANNRNFIEIRHDLTSTSLLQKKQWILSFDHKGLEMTLTKFEVPWLKALGGDE